MNAFFLFLMGIGWSELIIVMVILGAGMFFLCRLFVKKVLKPLPHRINLISITLTVGVLICLVGTFIIWPLLVYNDFKLQPREILFDETQPEKQSKLNSIPENLHGTYLSIPDSSYLIVYESEIILKSTWDSDFSLSELDSADRLDVKDTVYHDGNGTMTVKVRHDSVFQRTISFDTLYSLSENYVLKEAKGYYFLNKSIASKWGVQTLKLIGNEILLSSPRSKDELAKLEMNDLSESDTINLTFPQDDEYSVSIYAHRSETRFIKIKN